MSRVNPAISVHRSADAVRCTDADGRPVFTDTAVHLHDGVLRLLGIGLETFLEALEGTEASDAETAIRTFARGLTRVRGFDDVARQAEARGTAVREQATRELWIPWVAKAPNHGILRRRDGSFGWLARHDSGGWVPERTAPAYDEGYFEGHDPTGVYGDYDADAEWRIEKARGLIGEREKVTDLRGAAALDIGSGYGYFRVALDERGIQHSGIDVSSHGIRAANRKFGFETLEGTVALHRDRLAGRFDLVTLWDVIEHVPDPEVLLEDAVACLRPGGVIALRTPSLACPEADLLGPHYHSLQRPHLVYFSPASLRRMATGATLRELVLRTTSHFLRGFVGDAQVASWAAAERGSDIIAAFEKPASADGD